VLDHHAVVNYLFADIKRRSVQFQRSFHGCHRPVNSSTKTARRCQQDFAWMDRHKVNATDLSPEAGERQKAESRFAVSRRNQNSIVWQACAVANSSSPTQPWPVHVVSAKVKGWIEKLDWVWIQGQVVQLNRRPGGGLAYAVLRDTEQDSSVDLTMFTSVLDGLELQAGHKVVVEAKPEFWTKRGRLSFRARQIRLAGVGELLAQIERLKRHLAAEGLFDPDRKKALPLLPNLVGLITGQDSDAEKDVIQVARNRWPSVNFAIQHVAVQGPAAASQMVGALTVLDGNPPVEVIVIARGGGAVEDLLPFSDETLVRAVAAATTPVISAIGHQADAPLLDLVADFRAATPTDAAKNLVPDAAGETALVAQGLARMRGALQARLERERAGLAGCSARKVLADPTWIIGNRRSEVVALAKDATNSVERVVTVQMAQIAALAAKLAALSPQATLNRGYALVTTKQGQLVSKPSQVPAGTPVLIKLAEGKVSAKTTKGLSSDAHQPC